MTAAITSGVLAMNNKIYKEWSVDIPWGKIAMVSWGDPTNPPILMVHGYMDSAATFIRLVDQLPDKYYYVGFDFPGHGRSDPFPPGPPISHVHLVESVRVVVDHMKWDKFIYLGHSQGFLIGVYYNNVFPGRILKMVNMDPGPTMPLYYFTTHDPQFYAQIVYNEYYGNYKRYNSGKPKLYTYDEAVSLVAKNRHMPKEQAEVVLSRCLVPVGKDMYKLSWEPRMKRTVSALIADDTMFSIVTTNPPPMLNIHASQRNMTHPERFEKSALKMWDNIRKTVPYYNEITVKGRHDVHITNPELFVNDIVDFLVRDFTPINNRAKL